MLVLNHIHCEVMTCGALLSRMNGAVDWSNRCCFDAWRASKPGIDCCAATRGSQTGHFLSAPHDTSAVTFPGIWRTIIETAVATPNRHRVTATALLEINGGSLNVRFYLFRNVLLYCVGIDEVIYRITPRQTSPAEASEDHKTISDFNAERSQQFATFR